ncbi:glycosyltransferase 87 family protein [Microbacterium sp. P06]|uniref:glycosyltransferase 87 family protein n=1 Tax=Microbacterium sp. P06 TaxID=3366949 RepID=UPI0037463D0A
MSKRGVLWIAFVLVHAAVGVAGFVLPSNPMGDVYLVYEPWSARALTGGGIVGITEPWVYPQLALVPLVMAWAFGFLTYTVGWAVFVTALDAVVFGMLVGTARSRGRVTGAWFWLAAILLLGPVGMYRLDGVTVPLAIAGSLWLVGRPWLGAILLAVATWIKVWPAAVLAAAFVTLRRRFTVVGGALAVSALTLVVIFIAGGGAYAFSFVSEQTDRGLQIEAPVSGFYMLLASLGVDGASIYYEPNILTFQVTGPNVDPVIAAMTPLMVIAIGSVFLLGAVKTWRGASFASVFPVLTLGLVVGFIVFNKVGSPQYIVWLVTPVLIGLVLDRAHWARPAVLTLAIAALTQGIYPLAYDGLLVAQLGAVLLLNARNLLLVVLFVWVVVRLCRVRTRAGAASARRRAAAVRG